MSSRRRFTWRKAAVFASGLLLVSLADPRPASFAAGCCLVAAAWALRIWAFGHLEKNVVLVTSGPYAHTRNPAYLGSFLALVGVCLAAGNPETTRGRLVWAAAALLLLVFLGAYLPRKFQREYPRLRALFGPEFERHAANVPDFFPRLTRWPEASPRRFSWQRVGENHEWPWGLVLTLVLAALWFAPRWSPLARLWNGDGG
ncbi:MAG: isoprenylcysteine carboxylmethyltransferase family protein [Planctomycetota bacterium]|nr:MAG: isoprenylcysteine carboxylmethyltransferase family protein [Planctomycetota bacterium]